LANDGDPATDWQPAAGDSQPWLTVDPERILTYRRLHIRFSPAGRCNIGAEAQAVDGTWLPLASTLGTSGTLELATPAIQGKSLRLTLSIPPGATCGIAEVGITGTLRTN
jgi:hypothetical protein